MVVTVSSIEVTCFCGPTKAPITIHEKTKFAANHDNFYTHSWINYMIRACSEQLGAPIGIKLCVDSRSKIGTGHPVSGTDAIKMIVYETLSFNQHISYGLIGPIFDWIQKETLFPSSLQNFMQFATTFRANGPKYMISCSVDWHPRSVWSDPFPKGVQVDPKMHDSWQFGTDPCGLRHLIALTVLEHKGQFGKTKWLVETQDIIWFDPYSIVS